MQIKNYTLQDLRNALDTVNREFDNNVKFYDSTPEWNGRGWRVRLGVNDSHGKGARVSYNGVPFGRSPRHLPNACWHVHGSFFEALPSQAVIYTLGEKRTAQDWHDWNVGSQMYPVYASESCECDSQIKIIIGG